VFSTEEDKKAAEDLFQNFIGFGIKVGMDRQDFNDGIRNQRQWQIDAPSKNRTWCTGCGITFADAYQNLLTRLEEYDKL